VGAVVSEELASPFGRLRKSVLVRNTAALYGVHFANLLLPLVTVPFLARVLRPEGWGVVVFAQSFAAWSGLILEYGFHLSGTRRIATARGNREELTAVVAGVQGAKLILLLVLTTVTVLAYLTIPTFRSHPVHLFWAWLLAVGQGASPFWYFQGIERMKAAASLEVMAKVLATAGIFLLVRGPEDGWMVLALQALAALFWAGVATRWIYAELPFIRMTLDRAVSMLREGAVLFAFRGASGLYMQANGFVLGLLSNAATVAYFGGAERVIRAAIGLIQPVSQALYPRLSQLMRSDRLAALRLLRTSLLVVGGLGIAVGAAAAVGAPFLVEVLLGPGYVAAIPVLRLLAILAPIVALGTVAGIQWALPMGYDRQFLIFVMAGGALNLIGAAFLVPRYGAVGMGVAVVIAEAAVLAALLGLAWREGGGSWRGRDREIAGTIETRA
jgi:PST family polysaccharide transporter